MAQKFKLRRFIYKSMTKDRWRTTTDINWWQKLMWTFRPGELKSGSMLIIYKTKEWRTDMRILIYLKLCLECVHKIFFFPESLIHVNNNLELVFNLQWRILHAYHKHGNLKTKPMLWTKTRLLSMITCKHLSPVKKICIFHFFYQQQTIPKMILIKNKVNN